MATGRTVSASFLTDLDKKVIELCEKIAQTIQNTIKDKDLQKDFKTIYNEITPILQKQDLHKGLVLSSKLFPTKKVEFVNCPVCLCPISSQPANFAERERHPTWQPEWRPSKKGEGEDASVQVMHVNPLIDKEIRHNAKNVRYGHRWCNVAMTDHSLDETLDFMEFIVKAHNRI